MKKISSLGLTSSEENALEFLIQRRIDNIVRCLDDTFDEYTRTCLIKSKVSFENLKSKLFEDT